GGGGLSVVGVSTPGKHGLVAGFGAARVASGDGVQERVRAVAPEGVDAILDMVGGDALRSVAGLVTDPKRLTSIADRPLALELGGFSLERDRSTAVLTELARLVAAGELDPHVTVVKPLAEAGEALALVEGGHATGKVVIVP